MAKKQQVFEVVAAQRSPEWFAARRGRITASRAGAIFGVAPYMTRDDVMRAMVREFHGAEDEFKGNIATEYGQFNEAGAIFEFNLDTMINVRSANFYAFEDWAGATPDGLIGDDTLIEVKCPFSLRKAEAPVPFKTIAEQEHYWHQMQFQMYVIPGRKKTLFHQWAPNGKKTEVVEKSRTWAKKYVPLLKAFYAEYLHEREHNFQVHLEPKRPAFDGMDVEKLLEEYDDLTDAMDRAKVRRDEVIEELSIIAGGKNATLCGRLFTHVTKSGSISYAKVVKENLPDLDLEPYRGAPSAFWKLS